MKNKDPQKGPPLTPEQVAQKARKGERFSKTPSNKKMFNLSKLPSDSKNGRVKPKYEALTKEVKYDGDYMNWKTQRRDPVTLQMIERLALEIVDWALNTKDALLLKEFLHAKGVGSNSWYEWYEKYPLLKEAHANALDILNSRREKLAYERKLDTSAVRWSMPLYSKEFKELEEWRSKLKSEQNINAGIKIVELPALDPQISTKKQEEE